LININHLSQRKLGHSSRVRKRSRSLWVANTAEIIHQRCFSASGRGLTTTDPGFARFQQQYTLPVQSEFAGLEASTGLASEEAQQAIRSAIASLQGQAGVGGISQGLALQQASSGLAEQQKQFDLQRAFSEREFNELVASDVKSLSYSAFVGKYLYLNRKRAQNIEKGIKTREMRDAKQYSFIEVSEEKS